MPKLWTMKEIHDAYDYADIKDIEEDYNIKKFIIIDGLLKLKQSLKDKLHTCCNDNNCSNYQEGLKIIDSVFSKFEKGDLK